jgi:hypothetical protein
MRSNDTEQLFMLRLWKEEGDTIWRASLKRVGQENEAAQYFHTIQSLVKFLKNKLVQE